MALYFYDIAGDNPFRHEDGIELPNDGAAWRDAVRLLRDAEDSLLPDGIWILTVRQDQRLVYVIEVSAKIIDLENNSGVSAP